MALGKRRNIGPRSVAPVVMSYANYGTSPVSAPKQAKTRTDLQHWSASRNWNKKRSLNFAIINLDRFLDYAVRKTMVIVDSSGAKKSGIPSIITNEEYLLLAQARDILGKVSRDYHENYFKAREASGLVKKPYVRKKKVVVKKTTN